MAYIVQLSETSTSVTVNVQDLSSPVSSYRYVDFSCEGMTLSTSSFYGSPPYVYSGSVTFTGLSPGRTYYIRARVYYGSTGSSLIEGSVETLPPVYVPNPYSWSWNSTEQYALYNKGKVSTITWGRWNEFVEQVRKTAVWYHGSDIYYTYEAKMTSSDRKMTAYRFNTLRIAIDKMNPDGDGLDDSLIAKGKALKGFYFIRLSERYNSITKPVTYSLGTYEQLHNIDLLHDVALLEDLNRSRRRD